MNGGMPFPVEVGPNGEARPIAPAAVSPAPNQVGQAVVEPMPNIFEALYVMGWSVQTQTDVRLDDQVAEVSGETLYVWPVRKER
jgi:hypothetical protein